MMASKNDAQPPTMAMMTVATPFTMAIKIAPMPRKIYSVSTARLENLGGGGSYRFDARDDNTHSDDLFVCVCICICVCVV